MNCRASREQSQACLSFAKAQPTIICDNSEFSGGVTNTAKFSLYVSPYLVASQGGKYTKHIYIGSQRIVSKLGDLASYGADPRRIPYAGTEADGVSVDYQTKYNLQQQAIKDNYADFGVPYNGEDNNDYVNGEGFCCNDGTPTVARAKATRSIEGNLTLLNLGGTRQSSSKLTLPSLAQGFKPNDDYEKMQFYYHPDHLGSSSYITNLDGEVVQHIEYVPFGEVFIEERNNTWNTPYLFNAKEYDEETGMYYYGARYYEPRISLWMSVDPLLVFDPQNEENYIEGQHNGGVFNSYNLNPYSYCYQNPIIITDPNGKQNYFQDGINKIRGIVQNTVSKTVERVCIYVVKEAPRLARAYVEQRLDNVIKKGEPKSTSLALTLEFITGLGPENRKFSSSHPFTQSLKESNMTTVALKAFYKGYQEYKKGLRAEMPNSYRVDFGPTSGDTGPIREAFYDGKFTAAQFVGTAYYTFRLENDNLHVTVEDTKNEYSFLYHIPGTDRHARSEKQLMGETKQKYVFVIKMSELQKRAEQ